MKKIHIEDWWARGTELFGPDQRKWVYRCPVCKHEASHQDYLDAGGDEGMIGFSCIGRLKGGKSAIFDDGKGPCDYAGGGLFRLNPVHVCDGDHVRETFEFGEPRNNDKNS